MARFLLPLLLCIAAALPGCAREEALPGNEAWVPAQKRDPEQRREASASMGASRHAALATPRDVTDLGREAEREEEEFLKRQKLAPGQQ